MRKVIIATYEGIYSTPLVEALINNPHVEVIKIVKSGTIYANKKGIKGILFLLKHTSLLFIVAKSFETMLAKIY